jgi:hypothetical protein
MARRLSYLERGREPAPHLISIVIDHDEAIWRLCDVSQPYTEEAPPCDEDTTLSNSVRMRFSNSTGLLSLPRSSHFTLNISQPPDAQLVHKLSRLLWWMLRFWCVDGLTSSSRALRFDPLALSSDQRQFVSSHDGDVVLYRGCAGRSPRGRRRHLPVMPRVNGPGKRDLSALCAHRDFLGIEKHGAM